MTDYEVMWREVADENKWLRDQNDRLRGSARENPTLRDQFAMAALTGIVRGTPVASAQVAASCAYVFADAMLEARKEKK